MRRTLIILFLLLTGTPLWATTYYVDNCVVVGSDSNNGTATGTPWLTLGKVNGSSFNPGDSVLFERTCTFRGQLYPASSGSAGNPVTYGAYGTGAIPIIDAATLVNSGWSLNSADVWQATLTTQPNQVFFNGTFGTIETSIGTVTAPNKWWWSSNVLYVYSTSNPATAFTRPGVEASTLNNALTYGASSLSYFTYTNLQAQYANAIGIYIDGTNSNPGIVIGPGVVSTYNWTEGIELQALTGPLITQSTATYNGFNGMDMSSATTDGVYDRVIANYNCTQVNGGANNFCAGVKTFDATGATTIKYSVSCYNGLNIPTPATNIEGEGIWFDTNGPGSIIEYNVVCGNWLGGIDEDVSGGYTIIGNVVWGNDVSAATGQWESSGIFINTDAAMSMTGSVIYNNTVYANGNTGIAVIGPNPTEYTNGCTNILVENNIVVGTVAGPALAAEYGCENASPFGSGNTYTYNSFDVASSNFLEWGAGTFFSTYATWEAATGNCGSTGCSHSIQTPPTFTSTASHKFTLASGSSAISAGTNLGATYQNALSPLAYWPTSVALLNQNTNGWTIGAYAYSGSSVAPPSSFIVGSKNVVGSMMVH